MRPTPWMAVSILLPMLHDPNQGFCLLHLVNGQFEDSLKLLNN